ncbi:MAG: DUF2165 family protein [Rhodospirillales bacterium]|nr:DUF2165 family protein [Rhodospirillales bacterium]
MESDAFLLAKALVTAMPAAWLTLGVLDNIIHPSVNRNDVARVLALEAVEGWPEVKQQVGHRAITKPMVGRIVFSFVLLGELLATALLWAGSIWFFLAWLGTADACANDRDLHQGPSAPNAAWRSNAAASSINVARRSA